VRSRASPEAGSRREGVGGNRRCPGSAAPGKVFDSDAKSKSAVRARQKWPGRVSTQERRRKRERERARERQAPLRERCMPWGGVNEKRE
jgi:hypothetical protein